MVGPGSYCVPVKLRSGSHTRGPAARADKRDRAGPGGRRGAEACTAVGAKDWSRPEADLFPVVGAGGQIFVPCRAG